MTLAFRLLDTAAPVVKRRYDDRQVWDLTFKKNKALGWLPRKTGISGSTYESPITLGNIAGGSAEFPEAVASRQGTQHVRWEASRVKSYQTATIDNETLEAMKDDKGAWFRAVTSQIDSAFSEHGRDTGWALYQDGSGVRGVVAGATPADDPTDENATLLAGQARSFALGMRCYFYPAASSVSRGEARVSAINLATNTVTFDTDLTTVGTGVLATDRIVRAGDLNKKINGFAALFPDPTTITTGDSFYNVDRSVYKERLLGLHYDGTSDADFGVALRNAGAVGVDNEGMMDVVFMNPIDVGILDNALDGDREYDKVASQDGHIGFDAIKVHLGGLVIPVLADSWCPRNTAYMLERDSMELFSISRVPDFVSKDGNILHRLEGADEVEFRIGAYMNTLCRAPGHNVVVQLA